MKNILAILIILVLPAFFYMEFASSNSIFCQKDWMVRNYLFRELAVKMLKDTTLPLWNPYILCGTPLFADIDLGIGYPFNILNFFLPFVKAVKWNFLLHISLAGIFMYLFLKILNLTAFGAFIGAVTFMLGGFMQSFIPLPDLWWNTIYIPLIFLCFELCVQEEKKIYVVFGGISLALQILSGVPQIAYYTLLGLFLYAIYHPILRSHSSGFRPLIYFIIVVLLGFSLSAFQLIPTYEHFLQGTTHRFQAIQDASGLGAMLPHAILFFIGVADPYTSGFIGMGGLFLALLGIIFWKDRLKFFFVGLCIFVLASSFEITGLYKILFHIPGFNMFKGLQRFIAVYAFGISVLAGSGASAFSKLMGSDNNRLKKRISLSLFIIICILILGLLLNYFFREDIINYGQRFIEKKVFAKPGHPSSLDYYYKKLETLYNAMSDVLKIAILPLGALSIIIILNIYRRMQKWLLLTSFVCILILELFGHWFRLDWKLVEPAEYYKESEAISFIKKDTSIYRALGIDNSSKYHFDYLNSSKMNDLLIPDLAVRHYIHDPQGMENFPLHNYWQVLKLINRNKIPLKGVYARNPFYLQAITNPYHNLLDLLNVKYILSYDPITESERWKLVFDNGVNIYQNKKVIPRAFITYNYTVPKNEDDLLKLLDSPDFDARETVLLDKKIDIALGPNSPNKVEIKKYTPLEIKIDAYTQSPGILVLGDSFYPGWRAKVNGRYVKVLKAYSIFRAIPIPRGTNEVIFSYIPFSLLAGCFISIITLIVIILEGLRGLVKCMT